MGHEFEKARHLVTPLMVTSPFVVYSMRPALLKERRQGIRGKGGTGKATAEIDTSAEETVAWIFDYCSRDRMRINFEKGNTPRLVVRQTAPNSLVGGSQKSMFPPLWPREFVVALSWMKMNDKILVCVRSVDESVDYGQTQLRLVRAFTTGFYEIERVREDICSVVFYQQFDLSGMIPVWINDSELIRGIGVLNDLRVAFQRNDEVDLETRLLLISDLISTEDDEPFPDLLRVSAPQGKSGVIVDFPTRKSRQTSLFRRPSFFFAHQDSEEPPDSLRASQHPDEDKTLAGVTDSADDDLPPRQSRRTGFFNSPTISLFKKSLTSGSPSDKNLEGGSSIPELTDQAIFDAVEKAVNEGAPRLNAGGGSRPHFRSTSKGASGLGAFNEEKQAIEVVADLFVKAFRIHQGIVVAEVVVDAKIHECVAWETLKCSRQRTQSFFENDSGATRRDKVVTSRRRETTDVFQESQKTGGIRERTNVSESIWRRNKSGSNCQYVIAEWRKSENDVPLSRRIGARLQLTSSSQVSETRFDVADELPGSVPQTKVAVRLALGDSIEFSVERVLAALRHLSEMRMYFDKSIEVDKKSRDELCDIIRHADDEEYDDTENDEIKRGLKIFSEYEARKNKKWTKSVSPLTESSTSLAANEVWGRATTTVRAPIADVSAFFWQTKARNQMKADTVEKTYLEEPNKHNRCEYVVKKPPKPFADRHFHNRFIWRRTQDDVIVVTTFPDATRVKEQNAALVYGASSGMYRVSESRNGDDADVEMIINLNFGGTPFPLFLQVFYIAGNLRRVTAAEQYFQGLRLLSEYDEKDGVAVGEVFMLKTKEEKKKNREGRHAYQIRVANVVNKHLALKEFAKEHPWFPPLVEGMMSKWLHDPTVVKTKRNNLSMKEANKIGLSLSGPLRARKAARVGVDVWIREYPALVELAKLERWFPSMAVVIGQRKLDRAVWGVLWKVGLGAGLSIADVATDVYAVVNFTTQGNHGFARAVISMVTLCIAIQSFVVVLNSRKRGWRHLSKEIAIAVSGFKPAFDAYRVVSGTKAHPDDTLDPLLALMIGKICEM